MIFWYRGVETNLVSEFLGRAPESGPAGLAVYSTTCPALGGGPYQVPRDIICSIFALDTQDGADANGGYTVATAKRLSRRFANLGVDVLEQPLPPNALSGYAELRRVDALPIVVDEGLITPRDGIEMIRLGLIGGVAMKPARVGGLRPQRRLIEIVQDAGLMFLGSGLTDPDISFAASVQIYAAYGLNYPAALNGPQFLNGTVATKGVRVADGVAHVPEGAGLGVEVDEERVRALGFDVRVD